MTQLTKKEVKHHAGLARLAMTDDEAEMFAGNLMTSLDLPMNFKNWTLTMLLQ